MTYEDCNKLISRSFEQHLSTVQELLNQKQVICDMAEKIIDALKRGNRVYWCGNGGSAADCQHLAAELVGRFRLERKGLASVALTTDTSILTAISNDYGYDNVFVRQVEALVIEGDVVVGISTSGKSPNVLKALEKARELKAVTLGFSGRDGGPLRAISDICLVVPSELTPHIQEAHILVGHIICDLVEQAIVKVF